MIASIERRWRRFVLPVALLAAVSSPARAQPTSPDRAVGAWEGTLSFGEMPVAFSVLLKRAEGGAWTGTFSIPVERVTNFPLVNVTVTGDTVLLGLRAGITFRGILAGDTIAGAAQSEGQSLPGVLARPGSLAAVRLAGLARQALLKARPAPLERTARGPGEPAVDAQALQRLIDAGQAAHSDALVVLQDGKVVGEWYSAGKSKKIEAMSTTKSIVNLAVGRLVTTGALKTIDLPVSTYYPEWNQGRKAKITIRHLLNHTSGIQANPTTEEIYASKDFVRLALDAEITSEPGTTFFYNNKAANLLAGIVEKISGKRMDRFLRDDLFAKLGITDFDWTLDPAGNPHGMSGFQVLPADLARLGQLTLDRGRWKGEHLIAASWFDESLRQGSPLNPTCGLLWWLIPEQTTYTIDADRVETLRRAGADSVFVNKLRGAVGRYESSERLTAAMTTALGPDWRAGLRDALGKLPDRGQNFLKPEYGKIIGYRADGYLGQFIVIYPASRLVAVRMVGNSPAYDQATDGFQSFERMVRQLVR